MSTAAIDKKKVSDITIGELKSLLKETIFELFDPDYRLELRAEIKESLKKSLKSKERIPASKVANELNLKW